MPATTSRQPSVSRVGQPPASRVGEQITITISGYTFQLLAPYTPGQPLGVAEAGLLNAEWTSRVRAGFQAKVLSMLEDNDGRISHEQLAALQLDFQHFADEFAFKALQQSKNGDPLTRQKHLIAKSILDIRLNANGQTRQSYGEHKYEAALARLMNNPEIIQRAELDLAQSREAANALAGMEDLSNG